MTARILIVEDDRELQGLYAAMLGDLDCEIVPAYDGQEALQVLEIARPELLILDILLDEVMGETVFLTMKEDPLYMDVPVIIASALSPERCQALLDIDPRTQYLRKPFRRELLVDTVLNGLNKAKE